MDSLCQTPRIQTNLCPNSLAMQKSLTPFMQRGNQLETHEHLNTEDAFRRASTSSEANYTSGWTDEIGKDYRPATGINILPSYVSPQTNRKSFHFSSKSNLNLEKSIPRSDATWELKTAGKKPLESMIVSADKTSSRPRSTIFSDIRKTVFGTGRQANSQVLEELNRYKEKFQKEKMERHIKEGFGSINDSSLEKNLLIEQKTVPIASQCFQEDSPTARQDSEKQLDTLPKPLHTTEQQDTILNKMGLHPVVVAPLKQFPILAGRNSQSCSSTWKEPQDEILSSPVLGVFEFIPVDNNKNVPTKATSLQEKPSVTPQIIVKPIMQTLQPSSSNTDVWHKETARLIEDEVNVNPAKTQTINKKISYANPRGLSKLSRIDWAKKRFVEDNSNKFNLESLTQSMASLNMPVANTSVDDTEIKNEVASISSVSLKESKRISLPETESKNTEDIEGKSINQKFQDKVEFPNVSARVLRISPTPLKLHKLEKVTLSVSSPKSQVSTQNTSHEILTAQDKKLQNQECLPPKENITTIPNESMKQYSPHTTIHKFDEGVKRVSDWSEEAIEVIQKVDTNFDNQALDKALLEQVQIPALTMDKQYDNIEQPTHSMSILQDTHVHHNATQDKEIPPKDQEFIKPTQHNEKTAKYIQTTVKPIDLGLSFTGRKGIRPVSMIEGTRDVAFKVQPPANDDKVDKGSESLEQIWTQSLGPSVPIQTVTKLTSSNILKITSVTRGQPPQLISAVVQSSRPYQEPLGATRFDNQSKSQSNVGLPSTEIKSDNGANQYRTVEPKKPTESQFPHEITQIREAQATIHQPQKTKYFPGVENQHHRAKEDSAELPKNPQCADGLQKDVFTFNIPNKDDETPKAFQDFPKVKSSTYAHGPKISFASLKSTGKFPIKFAFREESFTYPGGYFKGEYYDTGTEVKLPKHVLDPQILKTEVEDKNRVMVSTSTDPEHISQTSNFTFGSLISREPIDKPQETIAKPSLSFISHPSVSQTITSSSALSSPPSNNIQASTATTQHDIFETSKTTKNTVDSQTIPVLDSHPRTQSNIFSQAPTSTISTGEQKVNNKLVSVSSSAKQASRAPQIQDANKHQQPQQHLQTQQQPEQQPQTKNEILKPSQKISISSGQLKVFTDSHKPVQITSTPLKMTAQPMTIQTSQKVKVDYQKPPSPLHVETTKIEKELCMADEDQKSLRREIEEEFSRLKIDEGNSIPIECFAGDYVSFKGKEMFAINQSDIIPDAKITSVQPSEVSNLSDFIAKESPWIPQQHIQHQEEVLHKYQHELKQQGKQQELEQQGKQQELEQQGKQQELEQQGEQQELQSQHETQLQSQSQLTKQEHNLQEHLKQPKIESSPQQKQTSESRVQGTDRNDSKEENLSKSALEFVDSSSATQESEKLLLEKRLSADDLIRESGKVGFKVNHLKAALVKKDSYAAALSSQKKALNQRGTAVESGSRVQEQLQQLKSPQPASDPCKKSPKLLRKPQPLLRSKTVDDTQMHHLSFGVDPDLKLFLKSRKERFSPSSDDEVSKIKKTAGLKDEVKESVMPMSERIKNMEDLVCGSFFSTLRDKALSSNTSTKHEGSKPSSLQASFEVISDVTIGETKRDLGKLKQQAMEMRRNIQQQQQQRHRQKDENPTSSSFSSPYIKTSSSPLPQQQQRRQQHYTVDNDQDINQQQQTHKQYQHSQQMSFHDHPRSLTRQQNQQQQQIHDDYYYYDQQHRYQQPQHDILGQQTPYQLPEDQYGQKQHQQRQRQREVYRPPSPEQQHQQLDSIKSMELNLSSLRGLPPQGMTLIKRDATRSQTSGGVAVRTSPAATTPTTPQRRSLCTKLDSDDEFDKLVEINYKQLVEQQPAQQQYQQVDQQFQQQQVDQQFQQQVDQQYQQPVQQQYQQPIQQPPKQVQPKNLDPRQYSQKQHERHHSPSAYPREARHPQQQQQQHHQHQQQQQQQTPPPQQPEPPQDQIDPIDEIAAGLVIDLVSQWDAAIEQKLLKQQQLQLQSQSATSTGHNVNASGNVSNRSPTSYSQKQTTHGDGRCPAGTTSAQRATPTASSSARRISVEDAATGDELTKLSISEKMKIFSIEAEKQRRKANSARNRRTESRYQTQPITWGEVESAQSHVRESSNQRRSDRITSYERHDEEDEYVDADDSLGDRDYLYYGDC